ncbi:IS982 family transposase [Rickettsia gravesii]
MYSTTNRCITTLFCIIDNYCKIYEEWGESKLIPSSRKRKRLGHLSLSELLTIVLYFYISPCKDFKNYYLYHLSYKYRGYFSLPSYSRIIHLWSRLVLPLTIMLQLFTGEEIGIYFIDSSRLSICHAKRTNSNKVFSGIAKIGMSSYGWCMGFKLHIIVNNKGQIMAIKITKGNASDVSAVDSITKRLCGKLFGDKAYISKEVSAKLFSRGLRLFTGIRKDMKNHLLDIEDKILLRRKSTIESVFNVLKNGMNLEHTRHRSPINFLVHILACLNAFKLNKSRKFVAVLADSQTLLS